jgi:hypothetical protein
MSRWNRVDKWVTCAYVAMASFALALWVDNTLVAFASLVLVVIAAASDWPESIIRRFRHKRRSSA